MLEQTVSDHQTHKNGGEFGFNTEGVEAEVVLVSPTIAKLLRSKCHFERQRTISRNNVVRLSFEMKRGTFIEGTPIYFCVLPDRSMIIMNGNHTLEAVADSGVSIPLVFIYKHVDSLEEAMRIYTSFDLHKMRTWSDAIKGAGIEFPMARKCATAIGHIMKGFVSKYTDPNQAMMTSREYRFMCMEPYRHAAELLEECLKGKPEAKTVYRAAVLSVALVTTRWQPSVAIEFWGGLAEDNGLVTPDPRKALLTYLRANPSRGNESREEHSVACALAWNCAYRKHSLKDCRPKIGRTELKNFTLIGTPWYQGNPNAPDVAIDMVPDPSGPKRPDTGACGAQKFSSGRNSNGEDLVMFGGG